MEPRIAKLEAGMDHVIRELGEFRQDMRGFRQEIDGFRQEIGDTRKELRQEIHEFRREIRFDFRLLIIIMMAVFSGITAMLGKGFKWF